MADPLQRYDSGNSLPCPATTIDEIRALPVRDIANQYATLWLWATNAHLHHAFRLLEA